MRTVAMISMLAAICGMNSARAETVTCQVANADAASGTSVMTLVGSDTSYSMKMPLDFSNAQADGSTFSIWSKPHVVAVTTTDDKTKKIFEFK